MRLNSLIAAWEIRENARINLLERIKAHRNMGRPRANISVNEIYNALKKSRTVTEAAQSLGISRSYIYQRFNDPDSLLLGRAR